MFVVMGGTGHVGSAVADPLVARGQPVTIVTRDGNRVRRQRYDVDVVEADINDIASLHAAFRRGRRAFLINPPADVATDTDTVERHTIANILAALEGSGLEKVVAASTLGAQAGERIGDLSVLWELEQGLQSQPIPAAINRGAFYMSNWATLIAPARDSGQLPTMLPADLMLPMVAPGDLGEAAADRLLSPIDDVGIRAVEGPARYAPRDVAASLSRLLELPVNLDVVPRDRWENAYRDLGFSPAAADSYARMTAMSIDGRFELPSDAIRGQTTLDDYLGALIRQR